MKLLDLLKISSRIPLIYLIISISYQLIFNKGIDWSKSVIEAVIMFLFLLLYEWSKTPYDWKKDKDVS